VNDEVPARARSGPSWRPIVGGLVAGTAIGLFLGDRAGLFQPAADGFVKLLQMAVLPYVTVSIVASIGALDSRELRRLGTRAALVLPLLWALALGLALLMPLAFPSTHSGAFFSTTLLDRSQPFSFVDLYIPANPFFSLANTIVPAVVLFSLMVGIALIGVPRKQLLLDILGTASEALARVMRFVVRLTPYGAFFIAANTAGTIRLEQATRLEIYLVAYAALALLLALWALPALVSTLTGIPLREIITSTREPLLTATIAGDVFIVLPVLIEACKKLSARYNASSPHASAIADVIVPVSYNFPHGGKLLSVSFVLFAGWFSDAAIPPAEYPRLAATSLVTLFGSVNTAVPYLLDAFRVPADTFQLFVASSVLNSRFGTLVAAVHIVAVALLGTAAVAGTIRWRPAALARYALVTGTLVVAVVGGLHQLAVRILVNPEDGADALAAMTVDVRAREVTATLPAAAPSPGNRLAGIAAGQVLRVGYLSDALPFAFRNGRHELVGFDVALLNRLAIELGVGIQFSRIERAGLDRSGHVTDLLRDGRCDIIAGGVAVTTTRAGRMTMSQPYLDETFGLVVADEDRRRFESWDAIREAGAVTIAVPDVPYYIERLRARIPAARLITTDSIEEMFERPRAGVDAFALPAERGSAWTLRYPKYAVVVPGPDRVTLPLALALPEGETAFATFVNTWIDLKRRDGTIDQLYRYWILGRPTAGPTPRWSIIRDVLHWAG
jgi:Na+/H+-dicarboxylate symporter